MRKIIQLPIAIAMLPIVVIIWLIAIVVLAPIVFLVFIAVWIWDRLASKT